MVYFTHRVYLDHNATTPIARGVRKAMDHILEEMHGNPSSLHTQGRAARGCIEKARQSVASLLGSAPEHIVFTSGGTEGNNTIIKGVFLEAAQKKSPKDCHIITTKIEHDSILGAGAQVQAMGGQVTYVPAQFNGIVDPSDILAAIRPETILISVMHANNETGAVQPVHEISRIAHQSNIFFHTDAVQSYGKIPTRVDEIGCDFLTLTAHKINGPKGAGAIYLRPGASFFPLVSGGDQERGLRTGTEGVHQIAGLGAAAELAHQRMSAEFERMSELRAEFLAGLHERFPDAIVNEAPPGKQMPGTINLTFPGHEGLTLLAGLDCYEVSVSIGSACTADRIEPSHVLIGMGRSVRAALSSIRMSMGITTSRRDMRYVLDVLGEVLQKSPEGLSYLDPQHLTAERIRDPNTFLIDLRFTYERLLSPSIPGAHEWSASSFDEQMREIPRAKEVILICGTGITSYSAGYRLANAGHPNVKVVFGGYTAWHALYPNALLPRKTQ